MIAIKPQMWGNFQKAVLYSRLVMQTKNLFVMYFIFVMLVDFLYSQLSRLDDYLSLDSSLLMIWQSTICSAINLSQKVIYGKCLMI